MDWMRGLGRFASCGLVVFVLLAGGPGVVAAHEDPCEPGQMEFHYTGLPEPIQGAPGHSSLGVGPLTLLRLETEEPLAGVGEWRWEVTHEDLGVVVENGGTGVWAADQSLTTDAVYEDEAVDLPGGEYTIRLSWTGAFSEFRGKLTYAHC